MTTSCRGSRPTSRCYAVEGARPLADYLESLAKVRDLDVDEIMPAHEWRFRGLAQRADDIAAHHERRLGELLAAIAANPDATSWDLAGQLTWSRSWDQYSGRMRISAVTETAAHVIELVTARADQLKRRRRADLPGRRARRRLAPGAGGSRDQGPRRASGGRSSRSAAALACGTPAWTAASRSASALISPPSSTAMPVRYSQKIKMATPAKAP